MATDAQSHNKKLKTENDELKHQLEELRKAIKLKDEIKQQQNGICRELCPHCPNSNKIYTNFHKLWTHITSKHPEQVTKWKTNSIT